MKFSKAKKAKMRKKRDSYIKHVFDSLDIWPEFLQYHFLDEEFSDEDTKLLEYISKKQCGTEYYVLVYDNKYHETFIAKLVYTDFVRLHRVSNKKVLANKEFFKDWLKEVNAEAKLHFRKYTLHKDGKIELALTDYRPEVQPIITDMVLEGCY